MSGRSRSRSPNRNKPLRSTTDQNQRQNQRQNRFEDKERESDRKERKERRRSRSPLQRERQRKSSPNSSRRSSRRKDKSSSTGGRGGTGGAVPDYLLNRPEVTEKDLLGKTEEEQEMMKLMGFSTFDSTKGKSVAGNDVSAVHVLQKRKYRQYMNRKGGFNRPLDFVA